MGVVAVAAAMDAFNVNPLLWRVEIVETQHRKLATATVLRSRRFGARGNRRGMTRALGHRIFFKLILLLFFVSRVVFNVGSVPEEKVSRLDA